MKKNGVVLTVLVNDYDLALHFYVGQLGLFDTVADTWLSDNSRYVCISLIDYVDKFMIHLKVPQSAKGRRLIGDQCDDVLVTLPVKDAESLHSNLLSKGVKIEQGLDDWLPYGGGFYVYDPFGNKISLFEHFVSRFDDIS